LTKWKNIMRFKLPFRLVCAIVSLLTFCISVFAQCPYGDGCTYIDTCSDPVCAYGGPHYWSGDCTCPAACNVKSEVEADWTVILAADDFTDNSDCTFEDMSFTANVAIWSKALMVVIAGPNETTGEILIDQECGGEGDEAESEYTIVGASDPGSCPCAAGADYYSSIRIAAYDCCGDQSWAETYVSGTTTAPTYDCN
jgi:hypothetical protein